MVNSEFLIFFLWQQTYITVFQSDVFKTIIDPRKNSAIVYTAIILNERFELQSGLSKTSELPCKAKETIKMSLKVLYVGTAAGLVGCLASDIAVVI